MTRQEFTEILALMEACWPHRPVRNDTAAVWFTDLADLDVETVRAAVLAVYRAGREFMPNGAQVRAEVGEQTLAAPSFGEAWLMITRAIQSYGSRNEARVVEALTEKHPAVAELAAQIGLRELGMAPEGDTTGHAQARERYAVILRKRQREFTHTGLPSAAAPELREPKRAPVQIGAAMSDLVADLNPESAA